MSDGSGSTYPIPAYHVTVDGNDITAKINSRLESLSITDNRGMDADELELVLSDHDGKVALPKKGAKISVSIGWVASGLVKKGDFVVDEVTHSGAPDKLTIRARSATLHQGITDKREESHHDTTLGALVSKIAGRQRLIAAVSPVLASVKVPHIDQQNESDVNLLSRLARDYDAVSTVKQGRLLFCPAGQATTVSGKPMTGMTITRTDGDQHSYSSADRDQYDGATASYHDTASGKRVDVSDGAAAGNVKRLRHTYKDKDSAQSAAAASMKKNGREAAKLSLHLALGRPELVPETPVTVSGWKSEIDGTDWLVTKVSHSLSSSGYTTQIEMEVGG